MEWNIQFLVEHMNRASELWEERAPETLEALEEEARLEAAEEESKVVKRLNNTTTDKKNRTYLVVALCNRRRIACRREQSLKAR